MAGFDNRNFLNFVAQQTAGTLSLQRGRKRQHKHRDRRRMGCKPAGIWYPIKELFYLFKVETHNSFRFRRINHSNS
jgi:hypothetical protein